MKNLNDFIMKIMWGSGPYPNSEIGSFSDSHTLYIHYNTHTHIYIQSYT